MIAEEERKKIEKETKRWGLVRLAFKSKDDKRKNKREEECPHRRREYYNDSYLRVKRGCIIVIITKTSINFHLGVIINLEKITIPENLE